VNRALSVLVLIATTAGAVDVGSVRITRDVATVSGCQTVGEVKSSWGHWGLTTGERQLKEKAAALGADTVLITSSKATDWLSAGIAYRCAK
jgi:Domain of unknown function (DUF4156)